MNKKKIVILLETDFRDEEAVYPYYRFQEAGFQVEIATDNRKDVFGKFGTPFKGTISLNSLAPDDFDAVVIPGGNEGPDRLRMNQDVLRFIEGMYKKKKIIAAICHGVWIPISAKIMGGKRSTCYRAIIDDLVNSGGIYCDQAVVIDKNIITSRHPKDLALFAKTVVDSLS